MNWIELILQYEKTLREEGLKPPFVFRVGMEEYPYLIKGITDHLEIQLKADENFVPFHDLGDEEKRILGIVGKIKDTCIAVVL
jgi:hypothetical protein